MDKSPLVSIILPTFNRADLLPKSLESALFQDYTNWELIVWDDGSTDDTKTIVCAYGDKRVRYYHEENRGMSYALNAGIQNACGEYIAFLDDDDQWTQGKLLKQLEVLLSHDQVDLVFGNYLNVNLATNESGIGFDQSIDAMRLLHTQQVGDLAYIVRDNIFAGLGISNFIAFDTVIIRRDVLRRVGIFNENLRNGMDFEYWWRLALLGGVFSYTGEIVLNRIKYSGSLSSPSLVACENHMRSLNSCAHQAVSINRSDLVQCLDTSFRNTWQNMIPLYAQGEDVKGMIRAFLNSLRYGFQLGTFRLFLMAVLMLVYRKIPQIRGNI
jgi:glycosyltransferase involved in cell wall biosynthesis